MSDDSKDDIARESGLPSREKTSAAPIGLRRHHVNLERVQRIHLGLDGEPMEFSAYTLAEMLQDVADNCDETDAFTLHAVARALQGKDEYHTLTLQQKKRGQFEAPNKREEKHYRRRKWLAWLAHLERQGIKTEAAIMDIAEKEGVSRATVFAEINKAEEFLKTGREILAGLEDEGVFQNPRPAKSGKD